MAMAAFKPATSNGKITHTIHTDHLGGTNVVTDQGGEVAEVTDYYPYGVCGSTTRPGASLSSGSTLERSMTAGVGLNYLMHGITMPHGGNS